MLKGYKNVSIKHSQTILNLMMYILIDMLLSFKIKHFCVRLIFYFNNFLY